MTSSSISNISGNNSALGGSPLLLGHPHQSPAPNAQEWQYLRVTMQDDNTRIQPVSQGDQPLLQPPATSYSSQPTDVTSVLSDDADDEKMLHPDTNEGFNVPDDQQLEQMLSRAALLGANPVARQATAPEVQLMPEVHLMSDDDTSDHTLQGPSGVVPPASDTSSDGASSTESDSEADDASATLHPNPEGAALVPQGRTILDLRQYNGPFENFVRLINDGQADIPLDGTRDNSEDPCCCVIL